MAEKEKEYSAYISHQTNAVVTNSIASGFIFTAITLLLTLHPEPSQISVQIAMFILTVIQDTFILTVVHRSFAIQFCVRIAPEFPEVFRRWLPTYIAIMNLSWILLPFSIISMYLLWNLPYLALASGLASASFIIFAYVTISKPVDDYMKKQPWKRK